MPGKKIIDKIREAEKENKTLYSFEYFPPKTADGVRNLYDRLDRMSALEPAWIDVTWGAGGSTSTLTSEICTNTQNFLGLETLIHMTCTNMPQDKLNGHLDAIKESGVRNILALRGDPPAGQDWKQVDGGFANAVDLVKHLRARYGDYFGIGVAGYPEGHLDAVSYDADLQRLKEKLDAGGEFVITQLFYDVDLFLKFVADCRKIGITAPIVPGIMPIHTYGGFNRMTTLCKTFIPQHIRDALEPIKDNDEAVKRYGVDLAVSMCKKLIEGGVRCLHFYTLNLEKSTLGILEGLALIDPQSQEFRPLPWRPSKDTSRTGEDVRPVYWKHRPKSYLFRTASWDEFPNGRWGDARSPAYGDLNDYHLGGTLKIKNADRRALWGEPKSVAEVGAVFARYLRGEIQMLPWVDTPVAEETSGAFKDALVALNESSVLTINSQPAVNGVPSTDKVHGWGGAGGFVYQKAYLEVLVSPAAFEKLTTLFARFPTLTYHALRADGDDVKANVEGSTAITWGVFIGKEVKQPTVVDTASFTSWRSEAFALLKSWRDLYDAEHESHKLLAEVHDSYWLVSIVENNYISGNVFAIFDALKDAK